MPANLEDILSKLQEELGRVELALGSTSVRDLTGSGQAFSVSVCSESFEGQTFLDREMRIRGAVARGLARAGHPRADYIIEATTPSEQQQGATRGADLEVDLDEADPDDGTAAQEWREQIAAVRAALEGDGYTIEVFDRTIIRADKEALSRQTILVGFASKSRSSVVDLATRTNLERLREISKPQNCYYLSPEALNAPFANQKPARWLETTTAIDFLHLLNRSDEVARALWNQLRNYHASGKYDVGRVVDPSLRHNGKMRDQKYFGFASTWIGEREGSFQVLMAPAGHGKTTICVEFALRLAKTFLDSRSAPLPLYLPFEAVRRTIDFEALVLKQFAALRLGSYAAFQQLLVLGRAVLIVDGFDELADDGGFAVAEAQIRSMRPLLSGRAKILLAGRSLFAEQLLGYELRGVVDRIAGLIGHKQVEVVDLLRFDVEQIGEYVSSRNWLCPPQQALVMKAVTSSPDAKELFGNPLLLRLLCQAAAELDDTALPPTLNVEPGNLVKLEELLRLVCVREESRQNLGIGVDAQLQFLTEIALDLYRTKTSQISKAQVRIAAQLCAPQDAANFDEVIGRLCDHALLTTVGEGVEFVHPLVREAIVSRHLVACTVSHRTEQAIQLLCARDLPTSIVESASLALREQDLFNAFFPPRWLDSTGNTNDMGRRNLARVAFAAALPPGSWAHQDWTPTGRIEKLDLTSLALTGLVTESKVFSSCAFTSTHFENCDFSNVTFDNCRFEATTFMDCRFGSPILVTGGEFSDVLVIDAEGVHRTIAVEFFGNQATLGDPILNRIPSSNAISEVEALLKTVLRRLVKFKAQPTFPQVTEEKLLSSGREPGNADALRRVIVPAIRSRLCQSRLVAGSQEVFELDKRWRPAVCAFLENDARTEAMKRFVDEVTRKAVRLLT